MGELNISVTYTETQFLKTKGVIEYLEDRKNILVKCYEKANDLDQQLHFKSEIEKVEFDLRLKKNELKHWHECCEREDGLIKMWELERLKEQNPIGGSNPWDL